MAVIRCDNGLHFYDNEKFSTCPHCASGTNNSKWTDMDRGDVNSMVTVAMKNIEPEITNTVGILKEKSLNTNINVGKVDDDVTVAYHSPEKGNDYVTGWLVCVSGPEKGRDYRIYHGINKMGRGSNMDISVRDDKMISREKVCSIVYDYKTNKFYILPASNGVVYLNGENINKAAEIFTGDSFEIGSSKFEFIAYCRDDKKWD